MACSGRSDWKALSEPNCRQINLPRDSPSGALGRTELTTDILNPVYAKVTECSFGLRGNLS